MVPVESAPTLITAGDRRVRSEYTNKSGQNSLTCQPVLSAWSRSQATTGENLARFSLISTFVGRLALVGAVEPGAMQGNR